MKRTRDLLFSAQDATVIRTAVPPSSIARRAPRSRVFALVSLLAIVLLSVAWFALAASDDQADLWQGVTDSGQIAVTLTLASAQDAKLTFGAPRFCTLTAHRESRPDDYSLRGSNGGYCDRLLGGRMKLTASTDVVRLSVRLTDDKGAARDTATLSATNRTARPAPGD